MYSNKRNKLNRSSDFSRSIQRKSTRGSFLEDNRQSTIQRKENGNPIQFEKYKKTTSDYIDDYLDEEYENEQIENDLYEEVDGPDVYAAWNPATAWDSAIAAPIPGTGDYTVTFQWNNVLGYTLRAHVHYTRLLGGGYTKAAGNGWVSGIHNYQFPTPATLVANAPADPTTV